MASDNIVSTVILANEDKAGHELWIKACESCEQPISWRVVNLCGYDWWEKLHSEPFDILLSRPGGLHSRYKNLYDERLRILSAVKGYLVFPSLTEVEIYENKRYLSFWLKANSIPHPATFVFYDRNEAISWIQQADFPLVGKTNIGASGSGVVILKDQLAGKKYVDRAFSRRGVPQRWGPNLSKGRILSRAFHSIMNSGYLKRKAMLYGMRRSDKQVGFLLLQEFIDHPYEWRVVRMGESFFAHKKLKLGEKTSGSLLKGYDTPPMELLDFVKQITDRHTLLSMCVDIFESPRGYLVNEMQCFFGQSDPHQMLIDGIPGRYRWLDGAWVFEKGEFNANESYNLRLATALSLVQHMV